jgi:flagellar hook protein FlgE
MDVIGNNIANVNTTAYKSKSINFSDMLYQTTQAATAPNATNNTAGTNARQIGLGVKTGAINTSITTEGSSQSTGNPFDLKITGEAFFVVTDGTNQYFTRDGSFDVDADGNLCMASTGYIVEGWTNTDSETGAIIQDTVKPIKVLSASNETYPASNTTAATVSGIVDMYDDQLQTDNGKIMNIQVLDDRGYEYNLKFGIKPATADQETTKTIQKTEKLYSLPASIKCEDVSTLSYYIPTTTGGTVSLDTSGNVTGGTELTASGLPSDLLKALETEARKATTNGHKDGTKDIVLVEINQQFLQDYSLDLGANSTLMGQKIGVLFSGDTAYYGYSAAGGTGTKTGPYDLSEAVLKELYNAVPAVGNSQDLNTTKYPNGLLVTEKTYTDGTATKYDLNGSDANNTAIAESVFTYSDVSKFLSSLNSVNQAQYTVTDTDTNEEDIDGYYTITLLGMTDSNGDEVSGWDTNLTFDPVEVVYDTGDGSFKYVGSEGNDAFTVNLSQLGTNFSNVSFDMSNTSNVNNGGKSTIAGSRDDGYKVGNLTGVSIGQDGTITANYDNGMQKAIAQISVATFANSMGLENVGDNLYQQTSNSGEFDGVGVDIKGSGTGYMTSGVLEMSNVDLSQEFTDMITTQRGFQANSRVITVSDTLLEELVNLKR